VTDRRTGGQKDGQTELPWHIGLRAMLSRVKIKKYDLKNRIITDFDEIWPADTPWPSTSRQPK